ETDIAAKNLMRVRDAGIPIALGTDAGNPGTLHGPSIFREMALMRAAGLSPAEVLRAATSGGAAVLRMENELGLAPGRVANLVVLGTNPLADVPNGTDVEWVIVRGVPFKVSELLHR